MASDADWYASDLRSVGVVQDTDGNDVEICRSRAGAVIIEHAMGSVEIDAGWLPVFLELLGRAAMPGQPQPCAYCEDDPDHPGPDNPGSCTCSKPGCGRGWCPHRDAAAELGRPSQPEGAEVADPKHDPVAEWAAGDDSAIDAQIRADDRRAP